jgi:uncharacterized protein involved in outer membrane biogenesis
MIIGIAGFLLYAGLVIILIGIVPIIVIIVSIILTNIFHNNKIKDLIKTIKIIKVESDMDSDFESD